MEEIDEKRWLLEFTILIVVSAILSGILYILQDMYFRYPAWDSYLITRNLIRMTRMLLVYVGGVYLFMRRHGGGLTDLGLKVSKNRPYSSFFAGIGLYMVAAYVFLNYQIFFIGWKFATWPRIAINMVFIGVMASITDFWTRGFILLELARRYNERVAIFWQNVTWFVLHWYEIELLEPSIGYLGAILLTLFLGIGGDLVALRSKSILGLMFGHIVLNFMIILGAKGYIPIF